MDKIINNISATFLFLLSLLVASQYARADFEQPTGRNTPITAYFDKQSPPSQIDIWVNESGGYDSSTPRKWGMNTLVCKSSSDPINGKCPTRPNEYGKTGVASIPLTFVEKRSKLSFEINVSGYYYKAWIPASTCDSSATHIMLYSAISYYCKDEMNTESDTDIFSVYLTQDELKKFPFGGIWEAKLTLGLMRDDNYGKLGDWNSAITLNVSDISNQAIYFPSFGAGQGKDAQLHADLNLRPLPGGDRQVLGKLSGTTSLDMCLYDGYGSNSRQFQVTLSEPPEYPENPEGRQSGQFSVYNDNGDRNNKNNRIDYGVKMYFPESNNFQNVVNGQMYTLPNINTDDIRAVRLASNISNVVLCVPTPLQISTPAFNIVDKTNGHYTGKIRVVFTPSLW
ncbi:hypothetical protein PU00_10535 [Hafnia alvei]|uniref:CfaE/CblD family pilus tip adhesin n=1 Tax=Hafnia alvei TaxID=569 RepID=UPI000583B157|nr:CfaE/CblD family pilus tip adhesin [Hafnia alvei]KID03350.1 hypothetical protein PU00_10535 [Hafnia alvei]